jgi:hypothetical protein
MKNNSIYWIVLIIILALVAYWLWSANGNAETNNTANNSNTNTEDTDTKDEPKTLTVNLAGQNNLGQSGKAVFTELNGKTAVAVTMTGGTFPQPQPAHIHVGACPTPGAVKYPLTNLVAGLSTTTIDATLAELKASLPLALNIHKSAAESSVYTACGDLKF